MIHFNQEKVSKITKEIRELHDLADVLGDINKIEKAIFRIGQYGDLQTARNLDIDLRNKYPSINKMIEIGTALRTTINTNVTVLQNVREIDEIEALKQDYYGILCDTAIKKGLIHQIEQFIDRVD